MKLLNHYRRFLFLPTMLLAATFASAQIPNDSHRHRYQMIPLWQTSAISSINWKRRIQTHIRTMSAKRSFIGPHMKHSGA